MEQFPGKTQQNGFLQQPVGQAAVRKWIVDGDALELGCTAGQRGTQIKSSLFFCLLESLPLGRWVSSFQRCCGLKSNHTERRQVMETPVLHLLQGMCVQDLF